MRTRSRRAVLETSGVLAVAAVGTLPFAGCTTTLREREPDPIDVDEETIESVAAIDVPEVTAPPPVGVTTEHVDESRRRAEALLAAVPNDLSDEIPNEAVRSYISEERDRARERLDDAADRTSNYGSLGPLGRARRSAAEAATAYATAHGDRTREDVYDAVEPLRTEYEQLRDEFTRIGDVPHRAVLVHEVIEGNLHRLGWGLDSVGDVSSVASEVEAAGHAANRLEANRATLETTAHLFERQSNAGDRTFDERFEHIATDLLSDLEQDVDALPSSRQDAGDQLFDVRVSDTPREQIGREIYRLRRRLYLDGTRDRLEEERTAQALVRLSRLEHLRRTVDRVQSRVDDGAFDRPETGTQVRETKETAVAAVESVLEDPERPYLVRYQLQAALQSLGEGDRTIEHGGYPPDIAAVYSMGQYALAIEQARAIPDTAEWFVGTLQAE